MDTNYDAMSFILDKLFLRRPREAILTDIIKIATMFIIIISKDSRKVKRIRKYVLEYNLYLYFLI